MSVKETLFNTQEESTADRAEWMAYMSQCHYEAVKDAVESGWDFLSVDEVAESRIEAYL